MFQSAVLIKIIPNRTIFPNATAMLCRRFCEKFNKDNEEILQVPNDTKDDSTNESVSKLLDEAANFEGLRENENWASPPYPEDVIKSQNLDESTKKQPKYNSEDTSIMMFPGQGIIKVGQVEQYLKFPRVREMFHISNQILGYDLLKMCRYGPQKILNRTEFNQPATVLLSLSALEKLSEERPRALESCVAAIGYSVGELAALIFSGILTFEEGIKVVSMRALAMQSAAELCKQGMLAALCTASSRPGKACEQARNWALDIGAPDPVCSIAIYLYTQFKIFGGCDEALSYIEKNKDSLGLRRVQRLPVNGAFHTALMQAAIDPFAKALRFIHFEEPKIHVYSNYSANKYSGDPKMAKKYLLKQLVSPVRWEQILHKVYSRPIGATFPRTFDLGSSGTMKTILNHCNVKAAETCIEY